MRIAQVITLFLPDFVGGATLACADLAHGLRARGHDVEVFCGRPQGDRPPYEETTWSVDGLPVTGVNAAPGYAALDPRSYRHAEIAPAFARFLDRARPDVVHFHSIQALGADLLLIAAERRIPIVVTMHDWWWWCARLFLVDQHDFVCPVRVASERCHCAPGFDLVARRRHLAVMLAHADRVLTPSRFLADAAIANGVAAARVAVCANGVDAPAVRRTRRPGPVRFGYFGGPDHRMKGLPTLLAAADRLDCGGFELVLHVGSAATRRGLGRVLTDRVGTTVPIPLTIDDRVRLMPAFAPADLPTVLAGIDCLVVPSLMRESYSLVTREALAAGVPVIASDCGGPSEILDPERNGLVFATGDAGDLARGLRRFVLEPGLADALRDSAAATPLPTRAAQVTAIERVYAELRATPRDPGVTAPPALRRVLFLAGCDGAPFRYRVTHLRDALTARGVASRALWWSDPGAPPAIAEADVVVVYRAAMSPWLDACLAYAHALGKPLVFSCDDLLFDASTVPHDALALLAEGQRAWWLAATARYAATLAACDAFLATTEPLAAAAGRAGVPGFVVRNGLGERELAVVETVRKATGPARADDAVVLAYFSGTIMHDLDFAVAAPALVRVLQARPQTRLRLGGHVHDHGVLAPVADRVERLPFLPWHEMLAALASADVQLAPLRADDPFTDAKSEVKYLEAGALGIPTVASPTDAFRRAIRPGTNGLLAATHAEWETHVLALIDDPGLRRRLGNGARDDVFLHATPAAQADAVIAALVAACDGALVAARDHALAALRDAAQPSVTTTAPTPDPARFPTDVGRYDLEPDALAPGVAVEASDTPSGFLLAGRSIGQRFRASADGLCRIDVRIGTDGRRHHHGLAIAVAVSPAERETPLRRVEIDAATLDAYADQAWLAATFAPIVASAGRDFYVWIESTNPAASAITLWTYVHGHGDRPPDGLHVDHAAVPGSLTFRTFHDPQ